MTRIFPLDAMRESHANVVLDLERQGIMYTDRLMPKVYMFLFTSAGGRFMKLPYKLRKRRCKILT